jgi:hypothetical protein
VYGAEIIDIGFAIVPIAVGKKAPNFDNWEKSRSTKGQLDEWIENGHKRAGVGILTKHTPGVDLDIRDDELAALAEKKARKIFGDAPVRIGMAPKRLLVYRTDKPFKKMRSNKYRTPDPITDDEYEFHQIEILCDGQQFVAYHIHPDTNKPYVWTDEQIDKEGEIVQAGGPRSMRAEELPVITEEQCQELIDWFEDQCEGRGWELAKKQRMQSGGNVDLDNEFIEDTHQVDISYEKLRATLMLVPGADDHDIWFQVGMALYHQFDGDEDGRELWHEWSETAHNYDAEALDRRWDTFDIGGKKRAPLTARFIIKLAKEAESDRAQKYVHKLNEMFFLAKDKGDWDKARAQVQATELDSIARGAIVALAKEKLDKILGIKTPVSEVRKALAYDNSNEQVPGWVSTWVYDTSDDKFFCTERKISVSKQGFDAMYNRKALTKKDVLEGRSSPSSTASELALNVFKIDTIQGRRYMPGEDPMFHNSEGMFANTYPEHEIPELPRKLKPRDIIAINRVKNHIRHLLENPRERELFCDWLSWIVQNPGQHANWSVLLQGVEGDGKSFFGFLLRAVMGPSNVQMLNAHILESPFTDWVVGQCVTCIEEVRLIKQHNKYELINRIKPFITNNVIEVHPKGKAAYDAINTTSYLFFSNYRDALPLDDDGRRYCVLFSKWQRKDKLDAFKAENPDYYEELYATLENCAPALRDWLLHREQSPGFNAKGDAPNSEAKQYMIRQSRPEFIQNLMELIDSRVHALVTNELLSVSALRDALGDAGYDTPLAKAMGSMLSRAKFDDLGRVRMGEDRHTFYTREPDLFKSDHGGGIFEFDVAKIKKFARRLIDEHESEL